MFWTKNSQIPEICDVSLYYEGIDSVNKSLEFARCLNQPIDEKYNIFVYWIGDNVNYKHSVVLKSFLATQDLKKAKLNIYSDKELAKNPVFDRYREFESIEFHVFDVEEEIKGTRYENEFRYVDDIKNHRFNAAFESDFFRILMLNKYGGFYIDFDILLLRDLSPLLKYDFVYQWGSLPQDEMINGAIMHLRKGSRCNDIMTDLLLKRDARPGGVYWASDLYVESKKFLDELVVFPGAFFNPEWQVRGEGFYRNDASMSKSISENSDKPFWSNPDIVNTRSYEFGFSGFRKHEYSEYLFDGCFTWHWHNKWADEIESGSKFDILDRKLEDLYDSKFKR